MADFEVEETFDDRFEKIKPGPSLSKAEQLEIDETIKQATPTDKSLGNDECSNVKCIIGTPNLDDNSGESSGKSEKISILAILRKCNYKTPPNKIACLLEKLFIDHESRGGHWLYVAQKWPPKAINGTLAYMIKRHKAGWSSIRNPAAYFTACIKYRAKRKTNYLSTNGTYKHTKEGKEKLWP